MENVKDNLCRSELIKVRLFDENFFCFLQEIIPLWSLDNELRCFGVKNAWFISFVIIVVSYKYFEFFPASCVMLIMIVSADCSQNNSDPSWAGQRLHAFQRFLDCTAHYNPTSNAGTSINYVQSSFYIQACSWIYIRNLLSNGKWVLSRFFPFQAGYHYLRM